MKIGLNGYSFGATKDRVGQYTTFTIQALVENNPNHEFVLFLSQKPKYIFPKNCTVILLELQNSEPRKKWEHVVQKHPAFKTLDFFHSFERSSFRSKAAPLGMTLHSALVLKQKNSLWKTMLQKIQVHREVVSSSLIITVTDILRKEISRAFSLPLDRIRVVPGAADIYFQKPVELEMVKKAQKNITKGFDFLLYVGKIRKTSTIREILLAFSKTITDPRFAKLKLIITGRVPYHKDALYFSESEMQKMTQECGIKGSVLLPGPVQREELRALYKITRGVICDTTDLGFPVVAFEAALSSTPMLIPNSQSYVEFFEGEYLRYDPTNAKSIRLGIAILADQTISKTEQTVKAQITAHSYTWQDAAHALMRAITETVEKKSKNR